MSPDLSQKLAAAVERMPAFPKSVQKILELTRNLAVTPKELIQIIEMDPVMTVKILKVVNSAHYNLPKQITSINHAAVFLGVNTIKNLALSIAAIGMLPKHNAADFDMHQYLLHSLATAVIAKRLAADTRDADPMDCFIAGLLHDFGKVVFAQYMPDQFRQALATSRERGVSLHQALQWAIGVDHALVGAMLAEKWHFAPHLVKAIRQQHGPVQEDSEITACVFAANQISKQRKFGFAGNTCIEELTPAMQQRLGGSLAGVMARLGDLDTLFEEAQIFAQLGDGS